MYMVTLISVAVFWIENHSITNDRISSIFPYQKAEGSVKGAAQRHGGRELKPECSSSTRFVVVPVQVCFSESHPSKSACVCIQGCSISSKGPPGKLLCYSHDSLDRMKVQYEEWTREEPAVAGCGLDASKEKVGFKQVEVGGSYPRHSCSILWCGDLARGICFLGFWC